MKKIIFAFAIAFIAFACKNEPKNYVSLSGTITNNSKDSLVILNPMNRDFKKVISVDEKGSFSDTLKIKDGEYVMFVGDKYLPMFLKNGYEINVSVDEKNYLETLKYTGKGAEASNYIAKTASLSMKAFGGDIMSLEPADFDARIEKYNSDVLALLEGTPNLDSAFVAKQKNDLTMSQKGLKQMYDQKRKMLEEFSKGTPSPKFVDYENYAGGTMSLDDLKGKYVYIDLWATWCGPCKKEFPFLKEVEKAYHDKNIAFVSISIDSPKAHQKWKDMVKDKELGGIQLYAKGDQKFTEAYKVRGIPRFILLDTEGKIINADAPRPSSPKLKELFNSLSI